MTAAQVCINWRFFNSSVTKGFSSLQKNGEFVDMTLAAEGHLVKVHQNIVALASPYLKAMIQSASCQHPVVFLNNVSHEILGYILEYIYTGEVTMPKDVMPVFVEVCKALNINGVENIVLPKKIAPPTLSENLEPRIERIPEPLDSNFAAHITINGENYNVEVIPAEKNYATQDKTLPVASIDNVETSYQSEISVNENNINQDKLPIFTVNEIEINYPPQVHALTNSQNSIEQSNTFPINLELETGFNPICDPPLDKEDNVSQMLTTNDQYTDPSLQNEILNSMKEMKPTTNKTVKTVPARIGDRDKTHHYTVSNRGSLQLLLNRYMYYCHHQSCGGRKRRWRCVDYRKMHCPAFIDTDDGNITNRSEAHCHPNHDAKIIRKFKLKAVFTSITQAAEKCNTLKVKAPKVSRYKKTISSASLGNW